MPTSWFTRLSCVFLLAALFTVGWWLAGDAGFLSVPESREPFTGPPAPSGPQPPAWCAPGSQPRVAPKMDTPFGAHLFASASLGVVHPIRGILPLADRLGLPQASKDAEQNENALDDVQTVSLLLEEYRRAFGAMPLGELNDEIVRRLQGENPKGIAVLPKTHPAINAQGELIDRWGTPYRFHPESAWITTVRSAGQDRRMWTADDVLSDMNGAELVQK
jgi:type II secretory pathway pseudopilin PulG